MTPIVLLIGGLLGLGGIDALLRWRWARKLRAEVAAPEAAL